MRTGLVAFFDDPSDEPSRDDIAAKGFRDVRCGVPSLAAVTSRVSEFAGSTLIPTFCLDWWGGQVGEIAHAVVETASAVLEDFALEVGNELNTKGVKPLDYAVAFAEIEAGARAINPHVKLITAGIFGCSPAALDWARKALSYASNEAILGYHPYREKNWYGPLQPWKGFKSRPDEFMALLDAAGGRRMRCTEVGYHTAPEYTGSLCWREKHELTDGQVYEWLRQEASLNEAVSDTMIVYQVADGPTNTGIDRYGMQDIQGNWKLQSNIGRWPA